MERLLGALREGGYALNEKGVTDALEALSLPMPVQPTHISQFLRAVRAATPTPRGGLRPSLGALAGGPKLACYVQTLDLDWRAKGTTTSLLPTGIAGHKKGVVTGPIIMQVRFSLSWMALSYPRGL
jgi:hypothetical protein